MYNNHRGSRNPRTRAQQWGRQRPLHQNNNNNNINNKGLWVTSRLGGVLWAVSISQSCT